MSETAATRELAGQRAVVTGSSSGIGRAIVVCLAAAGARVLVHANRSRTAAAEVAEQIQASGGRATVQYADLREISACEELATRAWDELGGVDIWVNNAGADILTGPAARDPFEPKLELLWQVDVRATILLGRAIGRRMFDAGHGVILNMGWNQAETGMDGDSGQLFSATKAAVMAFSKSLAVTLAPRVRVNCLAPGWIQTTWGDQASQIWHDRVLRETPAGRWGTVDDVAQAALFVCSPAAQFVTGQIIRVDGGAVR